MFLSKKNLAAVALVAIAVSAGCAATSEDEGVESAQSAQTVKPYSCGTRYCDCTGDTDCNKMFEGSDCATGPKSAVCQENDQGVPKCRCTKAGAARQVGGDVSPPPYAYEAVYFDPAVSKAPLKR